MSNIAIENVSLASSILANAVHRDDTLTFAGADTYVDGTILARQAVAIAVTPAADGGNTGNGTVTLATVVAGQVVPVVGAYVLICTAVVTNGGVFSLIDPNGAIVEAGISLTIGAGSVTVVEAAGLQFSVTEGSTDFVIGDFFTLTTTADGKLVAYVIAGAAGAQVPIAILTYDITVTGAGDVAIRAMVSGEVRKELLVVDADGDASNITDAILDQLRVAKIVAVDVQELNIPDNQ